MEYDAYCGMDVHKETISLAIAKAGRNGTVRSLGVIQNKPDQIIKTVRNLTKRYGSIEFAYEAGPCGYGIFRQLNALGYDCRVIAPSRTPRKPGDKIKNDSRDATMLARYLRSGDLTCIWVPDDIHEAMRDLTRAREIAAKDVRAARTRVQLFLLKYDRRYDRKRWGPTHRIWLADQSFKHYSQQIAFQSYLNAVEQAEARKDELDQQIAELVSTWALGPIVHALQALKGIGLIVAATLVCEVGDFRRFSKPSQLMAFLGLVPGEHSSGETIRPRGITKTGNIAVRALLVEAAWNYRLTPKVGSWMWRHRPDVEQEIKDISWKAQVRLCSRYRKLVARGKKSNVAMIAVARELLGFIWDIATRIDLADPAQA